MKNPFDQVELINFLDVGCSGSLDQKWAELFPLLAYTGFDPNVEECERLSSQSHPYETARYLPYAIAGEQGSQTMCKTENIYCYSLLHPNHPWLNRFAFSDLFKLTGTASVTCNTLNALASIEGLKADIIKLDTQGLELPILRAGNKVLENAFCVETETGFVENYIGETTYAQIDQFMRSKGFLMFDLNINRARRNNSLSEYGQHQPLWCEALWLFDYIGQDKKVTLEQALKSLRICRALKCLDYGYELTDYFFQLGILDSGMKSFFEIPQNWITPRKSPKSKAGKILSFLPDSINRRIAFGLEEILESRKNIF